MSQINDNFSVRELQEFCRKLDLPVAGLKVDIVNRLIKYFEQCEIELAETENPVAQNMNQNKSVCVKFVSSIKRKISGASSLLPPPPSPSQPTLENQSNWIQRAKWVFKKIPIIIGLFGGIHALIQICSSNQKIEIVVPGFSLW